MLWKAMVPSLRLHQGTAARPPSFIVRLGDESVPRADASAVRANSPVCPCSEPAVQFAVYLSVVARNLLCAFWETCAFTPLSFQTLAPCNRSVIRELAALLNLTDRASTLFRSAICLEGVAWRAECCNAGAMLWQGAEKLRGGEHRTCRGAGPCRGCG